MKQAMAVMLLLAMLVGCSGGSNPFNSDDDDDGGDTDPGITPTTPVTVPSGIAGNVTSVSYDADAGTLVVRGLSLDEVPFEAQYTRKPGMDRAGYMAFSAQEDALDRHFTAFAKESGSVRAAVTGSPGPRNRSQMGIHFDRDGAYTPPDVNETSGMVSYAGSYTAVTNVGDPDGEDLKRRGLDPEIQPVQAWVVEGMIFLNADFADNSVEGNIYNRKLYDTEGNEQGDLPSIVLAITSIEANGTFEGIAEYEGQQGAIGEYAGVFGGIGAQDVAGGVRLDEWDGEGDPLGFENEIEYGIFVMRKCGLPDDSPICDLVNP